MTPSLQTMFDLWSAQGVVLDVQEQKENEKVEAVEACKIGQEIGCSATCMKISSR